MTEQQSPPPGWYPDPQAMGSQRYWDGQGWTANTAPLTMQAPNQAPYQEGGKKKLSTGAIIGIVVGGVLLLFIVLPVIAAVAIPVFLSQNAKAQDSAARADVSTLGLHIATNFVDDSQMAAVSVDGDYYLVQGAGIGDVLVPRSSGVELGGLTGSDYSNWCVWVYAEDGTEQAFQYSAQGGLEAGSC